MCPLHWPIDWSWAAGQAAGWAGLACLASCLVSCTMVGEAWASRPRQGCATKLNWMQGSHAHSTGQLTAEATGLQAAQSQAESSQTPSHGGRCLSSLLQGQSAEVQPTGFKFGKLAGESQMWFPAMHIVLKGPFQGLFFSFTSSGTFSSRAGIQYCKLSLSGMIWLWRQIKPESHCLGNCLWGPF